MKILQTIETYILKLEFIAIAFLLIGMCLLAFTQVVLRNILDYSFIWGDVVVRIAVLWLGILGASIATSERGHIHIDLMTKVVPDHLVRYVEALVDLVATGACLGFFIISVHFLLVEKKVGNMEHMLNTHEWLFMLIFPIGLGLICFKFLIRLISDVVPAEEKGRE